MRSCLTWSRQAKQPVSQQLALAVEVSSLRPDLLSPFAVRSLPGVHSRFFGGEKLVLASRTEPAPGADEI